MQNETTTKPVKVFRCGAIQAAIWVNHRVIDNAVVDVHSVRITKCYLQDGEWKNTIVFAADDLPKVALVATEAFRFLRLRSTEPDDCENIPAAANEAAVACDSQASHMKHPHQPQDGQRSRTER